MDNQRLDFLLSPTGQKLLAEYAATPWSRFPVFQLQKKYPDQPIGAISEQIELRERARKKFTRADRMYFTKTALEQASPEAVAEIHARRYRDFQLVADICAGIGGDALALAGYNARVIALDNDPLKLRLLKLNAEACECSQRLWPVCADVSDFIPRAEALFIDPDRRPSGRRSVSLAQMSPSIEILPRLHQVTAQIGIKISAAYQKAEIPAGCEIEAISLNGQCIDVVLWFGDLKRGEVSATILPAGQTLTGDGKRHYIPTGEPGDFLGDSDPAVSRVGLSDQLTEQLGGWKLDPGWHVFSARAAFCSPFARCFQILDHFPYHLKKLKQWLTEHQAGSLTIYKNGVDVDVDQLAKKMKLKGSQAQTIYLTRRQGRPWVFVVERM